jgi:hypothetical protein
VLAEITSLLKDPVPFILVHFLLRFDTATEPIYYSAHVGNHHQRKGGLGEKGP